MLLGKRPATTDPRDLRANQFVDIEAALAQAPRRFGHGFAFKGDAWGMLGNAEAGDCCFAGGDHEEMLLAKVLRGIELQFSDDTALADYSAVTGYVRGDESTDNGTYVRDFMGYRQKVGLVDVAGERHRIGPYVRIDAHKWDDLIAAVYTFGVVGIGFSFPASAWDQFDRGEKWSYVPRSPIEGGHYVPVVGSMDRYTEATCLTWSRRQVLTREFYESLSDEAFAYVPVRESLRLDGTGLHHALVDDLYRALEQLKA